MEHFYYEEFYSIQEKTNWFVDLINSIDFGNFQNIILGLLAILIPLLIQIYDKHRENIELISLSDYIIEVVRWKYFLFFAIGSLITLSFNFNQLYLKIITILFSIYSIYFIIKILNNIVKKLSLDDREFLWEELKKKKWNYRINIWEKGVKKKDFWEKCLDKYDECYQKKRFIDLYLDQIEELIDIKKNTESTDDIKIIERFLSVYNDKNIKLSKKAEEKDRVLILGIDYVHNFFDKIIDIYFKTSNRYLNNILLRNIELVINNILFDKYLVWLDRFLYKIKELNNLYQKSESKYKYKYKFLMNRILRNIYDSDKFEKIISEFKNLPLEINIEEKYSDIWIKFVIDRFFRNNDDKKNIFFVKKIFWHYPYNDYFYNLILYIKNNFYVYEDKYVYFTITDEELKEKISLEKINKSGWFREEDGKKVVDSFSVSGEEINEWRKNIFETIEKIIFNKEMWGNIFEIGWNQLGKNIRGEIEIIFSQFNQDNNQWKILILDFWIKDLEENNQKENEIIKNNKEEFIKFFKEFKKYLEKKNN